MFFLEYGIALRLPEIPLIDVGGGSKQNLMPAELCEILPNQAFKGKLTDEHTASMITFAAKPPNINALAISTKGLDELGFRPNVSPQLAAFGITIGNQMAVVPARILPSPRIQYGQGTPSVDEKASWNLRNVKFTKGARLENWAVLVIRDGNDRDEFSNPADPGLIEVYKGFASMCRNSGLSVDQKDPIITAARLTRKQEDDPTRSKAIKDIEKALKSLPKKPTIILVLLSNGDKHVYSGLKYLCDVVLDVGKYHALHLNTTLLFNQSAATVCVHSAKIRKERGEDFHSFSIPFFTHLAGQLQYFANVALKFNTKLGGVK
jgi:hypothetical protein